MDGGNYFEQAESAESAMRRILTRMAQWEQRARFAFPGLRVTAITATERHYEIPESEAEAFLAWLKDHPFPAR